MTTMRLLLRGSKTLCREHRSGEGALNTSNRTNLPHPSKKKHRSMLGWLHRHRGVPLQELSLRAMFPSSEERSVASAFDFVEFLATVIAVDDDGGGGGG